MFHLCAEYYQASGRLSRTWIVEADVRPDTPDEDGTVAYPFNDMNGYVVSAHKTREQAVVAQDELEAQEE